jgi:uncharacterized repeat protein (TIGR04076 family)
VSSQSERPEGFCKYAWPLVIGATEWITEERSSTVTCCADGFRPVIFSVERIPG